MLKQNQNLTPYTLTRIMENCKNPNVKEQIVFNCIILTETILKQIDSAVSLCEQAVFQNFLQKTAENFEGICREKVFHLIEHLAFKYVHVSDVLPNFQTTYQQLLVLKNPDVAPATNQQRSPARKKNVLGGEPFTEKEGYISEFYLKHFKKNCTTVIDTIKICHELYPNLDNDITWTILEGVVANLKEIRKRLILFSTVPKMSITMKQFVTALLREVDIVLIHEKMVDGTNIKQSTSKSEQSKVEEVKKMTDKQPDFALEDEEEVKKDEKKEESKET
eukprot:UN06626